MKASKETRQEVYARFNGRCAYCNKKLFLNSANAAKNMTLDHFRPRSKGGRDEIKNLVASCADCNSRKGNMSPHKFCKSGVQFDAICAKLGVEAHGEVFLKADSGKPPLHYLAQFRGPLGDVAHLLQHGHAKYGDNKNWQRCPDLDRYRAALLRHAMADADGEWLDIDSGRAHLAAVIVNALFIMGCKESEASGA